MVRSICHVQGLAKTTCHSSQMALRDAYARVESPLFVSRADSLTKTILLQRFQKISAIWLIEYSLIFLLKVFKIGQFFIKIIVKSVLSIISLVFKI